LIQKALTMRYSDERLNDLDMKLGLITKALTGESTMVTCPECGHSFDYDQQAECTFSNQVLDLAAMYQRWIVEGVVREEMDKLKPEIRTQVLAVLDAHKSMKDDLQVKSIEDIVSYVRCPHCWSRVYRTMIAKVADTKSEDPVAPSNDTQQGVKEEGKEKHETNLSLAAKIGSLL
jgi:DNA-directed RNA polymerase subunit RPC12/RpoP